MAFSIKDITIKQGAKGEYKVLQGAIQTPEHNDPNLYNVNVCIFKDDPDYDMVEVGKVLDRTLTKKGDFWNLDKKEVITTTPITTVVKDRTQEQNIQLILSQQKSIWEALRKIGEHLNIEWFARKGNEYPFGITSHEGNIPFK